MKSVSSSRFQPQQSRMWDEYVQQANNGTLFHLRRFLDYHPPDRFADHSLILSGEKGIMALFPAADLTRDGERQLVSHPGASYGGLVTPVGLTFRQSYDLVDALIKSARDDGFDRITMTLPPTIYNRRLSNYTDFALLKHGFERSRYEVSSILFLEPTAEANLAHFTDSSRRAVKKALKAGVQVRESDDLPAFYDILLHNLSKRHEVRPTHTLAELQDLHERFAERIHLLAAYHDDRMVAGISVFHATQDVTLAFYITHDEKHQNLRALNLLFYEMIRRSIEGGFRYLDFGIFTVFMEPNFGLARFKESFGASGMFRDTLTLAL